MTDPIVKARAAKAEADAAARAEDRERWVKWCRWCEATAFAFGELQRARRWNDGVAAAQGKYNTINRLIPPLPRYPKPEDL